MAVNESYVITMVLGLLVLIGLGAWFFWIHKKNPEMTFGEIMNKLILRQKISVFFVTLILINVAEAIWAASITPKGEVPINALARLLTHGTVSLVAIVCGIYVPSGVRSLIKVDKKRIPALSAALIIVLLGALGLPYLNAVLISGGLKETHHLARILHGDFTGGFIRMSYAMQATVIALISHYFFVLLDGVMIVVSDDEGLKRAVDQGIFTASSNKKIDEINKNINKKGESEKRNITDILSEEGIPYLLNRYKFNTTVELQAKINQANKIVDSLKDKEKMALAQRVAKLKSDIEEWDKYKKDNDLPEDERKAKNKKFRSSIFDLFRSSTKGGHGFGMTLPAKN